MTHPAVARDSVRALSSSRIRDVANAAMGRADVLPFWFGESEQATPEFVRKAAEASLQRGETFYSQNLGQPALRQAIADYLTTLHGRPFDMERVGVTGSGLQALMLAAQLVLEPGDRVVAVTPIWPNLVEIPRILGATVDRVPLSIADGRWQLDADRLIAALTPDTRLLILNSPGNPTGWVIDRETQKAVFEHCRRHGIWVLADDVYERLVYEPGQKSAPSFLTLAEPEERVISANSFSKAWSMTGWRVGWLTVPPSLSADLTKLVEFNTSCVPQFVQAGALAAITGGEDYVKQQAGELTAARERLFGALRALPGVELPEATGAMYAFFRMTGFDDCMVLARALISETGLGLAPGSAFGPEGEGWLRWCYAASPAKLDEGIDRLSRFVARRTAA
jgi:aspartate/methionine/tyrosine aminotransferase